MISERKHGKLFLCLLIVITIMFPFANLFHILYPITLFGKSAWVVVPVIIIGFLYLYLFVSKRSKLLTTDILLVAIMTLVWMIISVREITYNESMSFLDARFITTSLLFIMLTRNLMNNSYTMRVIAYAVIIQGILVAAARSINYYFFPYVMVSYKGGFGGEAYINTEGETTRDILIASSISANIIVCGMFVLLVLMRHNITKLGNIPFLFIQFFMMLSTFNTLSRYPIAIAIVFFTLSFLQVKLVSLKNILSITIAGMALLILITLLNIEFFQFFERFNMDYSSRVDKFEVVILLITNSVVDFLIGSSSALVNSTMVNGVLISDNSYGMIATTFGVPFALVFFIFLFYVFYKIKSDNISLVFIFYIVIGLGITNSILWEPWVFTAFLSFGVVSYYGRVSNSKCNSNLSFNKIK